MFSKSIIVSAVLLAISFQVNAHAAIRPALGVAGTPVRNDVQKPSTATECGTINVANTIDTSTAVPAAADGSFSTTIANFNAGKDGSRQVTLKVDATGVGKTFVAGTVTTNGDLAPTVVGDLPIVASLPAGTKCTGGKAGNLCLASFTTAGGFGNCVVVSQGAATAAAGAAGAANSTAAAGAAANSTAAAGAAANSTAVAGAAANATVAATGAGNATAAAGAVAKKVKGAKAKKGKKAKAAAAAGTRAPRALVAELELRGVESYVNAKRSVMSWIWA